MSILRTKSVEQSIEDTQGGRYRLVRTLSALDLTVFGVGVIIGTGIFVLTGVAAKTTAGPAVAISFVAAAVACGLAALCYAEFAATVPVAGSAYTFAYATIGEFPAWIIGWDLVLELTLAAAVVASGWSGYFTSLLRSVGVDLPASIAGDKAVVNIPAAAIVLILTAILVLGIKTSARFNAVMVTIKVSVVLLVIVAGLFFLKAENYQPFIPPAREIETRGGLASPLIQVLFGVTPVAFGVFGIFTAAALVFFAYIGFDVVATAAEETRDPQRNLPIGILVSLAICTVLYVAVSLVVVGMQPYTELSESAPLADAFLSVGQSWLATVISFGGIAGLTTVVMILMLGQSRVFFAMCRDNLLPRGLARVHRRFHTPYVITIVIGVATATLAALIPLAAIAELVNIGTLFAFVVVSIGVVILRRTRPDLPRAFRAPWVPVLPILSVLACLYLMLNLPVETWLRFVVWMIAGVVLYFGYGARHSRARLAGDAPDEQQQPGDGHQQGASGEQDAVATYPEPVPPRADHGRQHHLGPDQHQVEASGEGEGGGGGPLPGRGEDRSADGDPEEPWVRIQHVDRDAAQHLPNGGGPGDGGPGGGGNRDAGFGGPGRTGLAGGGDRQVDDVEAAHDGQDAQEHAGQRADGGDREQHDRKVGEQGDAGQPEPGPEAAAQARRDHQAKQRTRRDPGPQPETQPQ
nr:amino acid permease [Microtetraspora sp. AC03309]